MNGFLDMLAAVLLILWIAREPDCRLGVVPGFAIGTLIGSAIVHWTGL